MKLQSKMIAFAALAPWRRRRCARSNAVRAAAGQFQFGCGCERSDFRSAAESNGWRRSLLAPGRNHPRRTATAQAIQEKTRTQIAGVCANSSLTPKEKMQQVRELRVAEKQQFADLLTPDQQKALKECQRARKDALHAEDTDAPKLLVRILPPRPAPSSPANRSSSVSPNTA